MEQSTFLALTHSKPDIEWLQASLGNIGQVLHTDDQSLDALLRLVEATHASLIFIGLDRNNLASQSALIEDCIEAKPMLSVVAMGDGLDNQLVLSAMRAGAKDFIAYGSRSSEVAGLVRRLSKRLPSIAPTMAQADVISLFCTQADPDVALIASHMALSLQQPTTRVLLLDLGRPEGESLAGFGLEASFHFEDALRNMRRLDTSLIESAFSRQASGLRLLSMPCSKQLDNASATEVYLLLGALRQYFSHIVINLAGMADSEALRTVLTQSKHLVWLTDQSVPNCRRSLDQLSKWRNQGVALNNCQLVVDRYIKSITPDEKSLAQSFALPLLASLPTQAELRLNAKNQGRSLYELAPRDPLSKSLKCLCSSLLQPQAAPAPARGLRFWGART